MPNAKTRKLGLGGALLQRQKRVLIAMLGCSSSSSTIDMVPSPPKYDVFLSFRGEDTRDNFTSHLYAELRRKKIETFIDYRLGKGDDISPALYKAIEGSMIYVIIFSHHYASSTWCLDELTTILAFKKRYGRDVIPVFYKVDPSNVRHQRGSYADAFVKHELRFKKEVISTWKDALAQTAGLSGWDSQVTRPESILVADIVKDILRRLNCSLSDNHEGMVGIDKHIAHIQPLLHLESAAVRIIGIWGMGGVGKTTNASAVYHKLATQFCSSSFVVNVQQEVERLGIHHIRNTYLSELLLEDNTYSRPRFSFERIRRKKVLLVLDDVENSGQVTGLIGERNNFGQGSRIILTSRDMQVLKNANADEIYEVKGMSFEDSQQLFSLNAFKRNYPLEIFMGLSQKVINYAKGNALALKVLGLLLYGRTRKAWESELRKLDKLPDPEIFNVLKLSYDGLDDEQKDIFLDIACFYIGQLEDTVAKTLDSCGFSADIGMDVLKDRCLISILEGRIVMHDLIEEMGKEIVRQQCPNDPGKRSRLWNHEQTYDILSKNKGTDAIQCIFLDTCKIKEVNLHAKTFKKMTNLRMLQFYKSHAFMQGSNVILPESLRSLPDHLKFLRWDGFPQRSFPLVYCPQNLVKLDMRHSHLEQLWEKDQVFQASCCLSLSILYINVESNAINYKVILPNLKRLDLSYSRKLIRIPNLSTSPNIEEIILSHCESLVQIHCSGFLSKLNVLRLNGCVKLTSLNLPSNILSERSGLVVLYNCHKLKTFSFSRRAKVDESHGHLRQNGSSSRNRGITWEGTSFKSCNSSGGGGRAFGSSQGQRAFLEIEEYFLDANPIVDRYEKELADNTWSLKIEVVRETVPSLIPSLHELCWLNLDSCESLTSLPIDLCKLKLLRRLYLSGCSNLKKIPEIKETMENLTVLVLDETAILELPSSLHHLVGLEELSLHNCQRLETIPSCIGSLTKLSKLCLTCCESLETFPSSIFKLKLTKLDLNGCSMLKTFPDILEPAESFSHIILTNTAVKELPSSLDCLVGLQTLCLNLCSNLESLPNSIGNLSLLSKLDCSGCGKLTEIPNDIGHLSSLRELLLQETGIVNLPESIAHLSSLESLDVSDCRNLECIPQLPPLLKQLLAFDCPSIRKVMSNSRFKHSSNSKEGAFKLYFTNNEEQHPSAHSNIVADARFRITQSSYSSVFYCFPGSVVPDWFPYRCEGHSVTVDRDSLNWCNDHRVFGFALCVVLRLEDMDDTKYQSGEFRYTLTFKSDGRTHNLINHDQLNDCFYWKGRMRYVGRDHTFLWKYYLMESGNIDNRFFQSHNFTFEISKSRHWLSGPEVKECGICPLYTKEKDDTGGIDDYSRVSKNDLKNAVG